MHTPISKCLGKKIGTLVDFFYFPFKKICSKQLFRYGVCGGINVAFGILLFAFLYNFVFKKENVNCTFITFTPYIAAFIVQSAITFLTGFWLNRYVSFSESTLRGKVQIVRYFLVLIFNFILNYLCLKFFVEVCGCWATPAQILSTIITTICSFFAQKYFSFKA
jgi:putative flippase GtrA